MPTPIIASGSAQIPHNTLRETEFIKEHTPIFCLKKSINLAIFSTQFIHTCEV